MMKAEGVADKKIKHFEDIDFYEGQGCEKCGHTGYKSRMGIYEVLDVTENIRKLIVSRATTSQIQEQGAAEGMIVMWQDGFIKAHLGLTTIDEVLRVSKE